MAAITQTCAKCTKQFLIIDPEQQFLREKGLPLPVNCPQCRQERRLALRGGRQLFRAKCQKCGKDIVTSYDPSTATSQILCREDYDKWAHEVDPVLNEPLPDATGVAPQTAPQQMQPTQPQMPQQVNYIAQAPTASGQPLQSVQPLGGTAPMQPITPVNPTPVQGGPASLDANRGEQTQ